jgi:hypothetical protein
MAPCRRHRGSRKGAPVRKDRVRAVSGRVGWQTSCRRCAAPGAKGQAQVCTTTACRLIGVTMGGSSLSWGPGRAPGYRNRFCWVAGGGEPRSAIPARARAAAAWMKLRFGARWARGVPVKPARMTDGAELTQNRAVASRTQLDWRHDADAPAHAAGHHLRDWCGQQIPCKDARGPRFRNLLLQRRDMASAMSLHRQIVRHQRGYN